jgi:hypothetical protein
MTIREMLKYIGEPLKAIDLWLIENVFEKIGFWSQRNFGVSALGIARGILWFVVFIVMLRLGTYFFPALLPKLVEQVDMMLFSLSGLYLLAAPFAAIILERIEQNYGRYANELKADFLGRVFRVWFLSGFPYNLWNMATSIVYGDKIFPQYFLGLLFTAFGILMTCFLYFAACNIAPPSESMVKNRPESSSEI